MITVVLSGLRADLRRVISAAVAIVLGVSFLAATLVIGDTMRGGFRDAFVTGNEGLAAVVRSDLRSGDDEVAMDLGTVPVSLVGRIGALEQVSAVSLAIEGHAQILDASGSPIGGDGPPTLAGNWIDDPRLSPWSVAEGRAPVADGEVVIDRASARRGGHSIGDVITLRTPEALQATLVGIATFAGEDSQGPVTQALFATETAQDLFVGDTSLATSIRVAAADGVDEAEVAAAVSTLVSDDSEVITGSELSAEQIADLETDFIGFFQGMLTVFAGIGLVVATLTIHNTFAIVVAQRGRQAALLRALGASRRQVLASVGAEAGLIGVASSAIGVTGGIGLAALATWAMDAAGFGVPGSLRWSVTSLVVAWTFGVVATLAAAMIPAVHASRTPPLAAVRNLATDQTGISRRRVVIGGLLASISALALGLTATGDEVSMGIAAAGVLALLVAAIVAGPVLARPMTAVLGWPIARLRGRTGDLARRNAARNPRRTSATAASLMVGVAIVVFFSTTASSLTGYINRTVDAQFAGDLVIEQDGFSGPGLPRTLAPRLGELDETATVVPMANGVGRLGDAVVYPTITDTPALAALIDLDPVAGDPRTLGPSGIAVSSRFAEDHGVWVGDTLAMTIGPDPADLTIDAIYRSRDLAGDVVIDSQTWGRYGSPASTAVILIGLAPDADPVAARSTITAVAADEAAPPPMDREEYVERISGQIDQLIGVVFALLAIAVIISVMGIGNTMSLSVHERVRELGLLRAVGMGRRSLRATVRWESVIVAVFGTVIGLAVGTIGSWAALRAFASSEQVELTLAVPVTTLVVIVTLGATAGILAALRPARRAARLDILTAIAAP